MISDFGIKKRLSKSFQLRQRAFFVDPYQAARARDIRRQNSRQSPLYVLAAQDASQGSGKLNVCIAQLWADVRLCPRPKWGHFQTSSRRPARSVHPPTADMRRLHRHVGFVPLADALP
jgi:hypothetical protein